MQVKCLYKFCSKSETLSRHQVCVLPPRPKEQNWYTNLIIPTTIGKPLNSIFSYKAIYIGIKPWVMVHPICFVLYSWWKKTHLKASTSLMAAFYLFDHWHDCCLWCHELYVNFHAKWWYNDMKFPKSWTKQQLHVALSFCGFRILSNHLTW